MKNGVEWSECGRILRLVTRKMTIDRLVEINHSHLSVPRGKNSVADGLAPTAPMLPKVST